MTVIKGKFWCLLTALAAGMIALFSVNLSRPASARTIEARLEDVRARLEVLKKHQGEDMPSASSSVQLESAEKSSEKALNQWNNWNNWNNHRPSWKNWSNSSWNNWSNWKNS
jgi:hypothetical protein